MAIQSYADLQAAVAALLMRTDLTVPIPTFISLAEADISRRLAYSDDGGAPPREMIALAQSPISQEFETTPPDFMGAKAAYLDGATDALEYTSVEEIALRKTQYPNQTGNPTAYTAIGSMFQFWPAPTTQLQINLFYIQRVQALSDGIRANWLLTLYPDCYLYGAAVHSAPYLRADARLPVWQSLYGGAITAIRMAGLRAQQGSYISIPSPSVVV